MTGRGLAVLSALLGAFAVGAAEHDVLVSFIPPPGKGQGAVERYHVGADGGWRKTGEFMLGREIPNGMAVLGDGWVYADCGFAIRRFRADGRGGSRRFCETARGLHTLAVSPDRCWIYGVNFSSAEGSTGSLQRYLVSDTEAEGVVMDVVSDPEHRLESPRQMAFDRAGLLYVGCRGNTRRSRRRGVAVLDVSGAAPREVAFYAVDECSAGFVFDPGMTRLAVHSFGKGKDRVFRLGEPGKSVEVDSGIRNSFTAICVDGEWLCGDYADGTVRKFTAEGKYETVAKLRPGLTAMVLADAAGRPATARVHNMRGVRFAAQGGPFERVPYNSRGTCDLKVGLWAFPMPMDFNLDGVNDLVVHCPDAPNHGTFLFAGTEGGVFLPPVKIDSGERWNVGSSIVDGRPVVTDREGSHWNFAGLGGFGDREFRSDVPYQSFRTAQWRYADLDGDGRADRICFRKTRGFWERCTGGRAQTATYGPEAEFVRYVAPLSDVADLDGDGLLDVLTARGTDGFAWVRNVGTRAVPKFGEVRILSDSTGGRLHMPLCMITPTAFDWDGDGRADIICGDEDGRVAFIRNTGRKTADGSPIFDPPAMFRQYRQYLAEGVLNTPSAVDWDGDGDLDIITGDSAGHIAFIENLSGPGVERPAWDEPKLLSCEGAGGIPVTAATNDPIRVMAGPTGSIQGPGEEKWGYTAVSVADWDGDGLPDVVVNTVWGYVYWHRNVGTRRQPRLGPATPIEAEWRGPQPALAWGENKPRGKEIMTQWRTTPLAFDWDGDGLTDLVMVDVEGYVCLWRRVRSGGKLTLCPPERALIDERTGKGILPNAEAAGRSGRRKLAVCDWDGDGRLDLFINTGGWSGGNSEYWRQVGAADGKWVFRHEGRISPTPLEGHSSAPCVVDFDADGVPDLLSGCEDGFFYYLRNPRAGEHTKGEKR